MRILKAADHRVMPWKNGGGTTTEIAVHPAGADLATLDWRVSMARVAADGPFSLFPGIDRTLAVLDGEGIELDVAGYGLRRLDRTSPPLLFPADAPTTGRLVAGPIVDLNVMTRRGVHAHAVERRAVGDASSVAFSADRTLLLPRGAIRVARADGPTMELEAGDALLAERGEGEAELSAASPVECFLVAIDPAPR